MKWIVPKVDLGELDWKLADDNGNIVNVLHWNNAKGTHVDQSGNDVGKSFDKARRAIEAGGPEAKSAPSQGKLAL